MASTAEKRVRLEMSENTLRSLLTSEQVCAADFHCLDCESKQCLWRLCLECCANRATRAVGDLPKETVLPRFVLTP